MVQRYTFVLYYLWIAPHVLLAVTAVLMYGRGLHKKLPIFFSYTLYETAVFLLLFLNRNSMVAPAGKVLYRYIFIVTLAGSAALRFGIIHEVFNTLFHGQARLLKLATASRRWITGLLLVAAIVTGFYSSGTMSDNLMAGVSLFDRGVAVIQAGLLLFLFLFARTFGVSWSSFGFGIALGFGILASTDLVVSALRMVELPLRAKLWINFLPTGSYHVSVLVWIGYLIAAEKPVRTVPGAVPEMEQWSGELEQSR